MSVAALPVQMEVFPLSVMVGVAITVTETYPVSEQPEVVSVPITEYVVFVSGETIAVLPEIFPRFHNYVTFVLPDADAVSVAFVPLQMVSF